MTSDFIPTQGHEWPTENDVVEIQLQGKDLDAVDLTGISALFLKYTNPTAIDSVPATQPAADGAPTNPVAILGAPTGTATMITVSVKVDPNYHKAFSFQMKLANAADVILTPVVYLDGLEVPKPTAVIQEITGQVGNPAQQQIRRKEYFDVPADLIKTDMNRKKVDHNMTGTLNVNINKPTQPADGH